MRRVIAVILIVLVMAAPAAAQDCAPGNRCGPVPWRLPPLPPLATATPVSGALPTLAATPTSASAFMGTPTPAADLDDLDSSMATLQAVAAGTPVSISSTLVPTYSPAEMAASAGTFFGYAAGLASVNVGGLTPLLHFLLFSVVFVLGIQLILLIVPLIAAIFGWIRRMVQLILDFLPG